MMSMYYCCCCYHHSSFISRSFHKERLTEKKKHVVLSYTIAYTSWVVGQYTVVSPKLSEQYRAVHCGFCHQSSQGSKGMIEKKIQNEMNSWPCSCKVKWITVGRQHARTRDGWRWSSSVPRDSPAAASIKKKGGMSNVPTTHSSQEGIDDVVTVSHCW